MYSVVGYVADGVILCPACTLAEYSGRPYREGAYPRTYNNRGSIIRTVRKIMEDRGYYRERYDRYRSEYSTDPNATSYTKVLVRNMRSWALAAEDALSYGARILDHSGMPISAVFDNGECDYRQFCDLCNAEIPCVIICHKDDPYIGNPCECEDCTSAREAYAAIPAMRLALREALASARAARIAGETVPGSARIAVRDAAREISYAYASAEDTRRAARYEALASAAYHGYLYGE